MEKKYVFVDTLKGTQIFEKVLEGVKKIPGVRNCEVITGQHDVIVVVEHEDPQTVNKAPGKIQMVEGVMRILPCQVIKPNT